MDIWFRFILRISSADLCFVSHDSQTYQAAGYRPAYDCSWTGGINRYDAPMYYFVAEGAAITGVRAFYKNEHE